MFNKKILLWGVAELFQNMTKILAKKSHFSFIATGLKKTEWTMPIVVNMYVHYGHIEG